MGLVHSPPEHLWTPCSPTFNVMHRLLSRSRVFVDHFEEYPDHLHRLFLLHLSDGSQLIFKTSPTPETSLLRTEQTYLDTEATVLGLLANTNLPIPRIIRYEQMQRQLGSPFLLTTCLPGIPYSMLEARLGKKQRSMIECQVRVLRAHFGRYTSYTFGPVGLVKAGEGFKTWREAFTSMFESILMDGEDMMVNVSYHCIREAISRWESYLDDVREARLVLPNLGQPQNILVDRQTDEVTGIVDFGQALWGDIAMTEERRSGDVKGLLYTCYDAVLAIVRNNYRPRSDEIELDARKQLTSALLQLVPERR